MAPSRALFLFDIDGTLLRGATAVHRDAFREAYRTVYGLPIDLEGIAAAGRTDSWLLAEPLRRVGMSEEEIHAGKPAAFSLMQEYVDTRQSDLRHAVLPGVTELLAYLDARGELLGLVTGNLSGIALTKLHHAGLAHFFDLGGFGEESAVRSHLIPVALAKAEQATGCRIAPERTVVVGDTELDIEAGKECGTRTAAVATGPRDEEELRIAGADLVFPSFAQPKEVAEQLLHLALTGPKQS